MAFHSVTQIGKANLSHKNRRLLMLAKQVLRKSGLAEQMQRTARVSLQSEGVGTEVLILQKRATQSLLGQKRSA